jgi:hypothetical protein
MELIFQYLLIIGFIVFVVLLVLILPGWSWGKIGEKCGEDFWLYALGTFVPILNLFLWVKLSKKPKIWVLAFFVPLLNVAAWVIINGSIAYRLGKNFWLNGIGSCIPILNVVLLVLLAKEGTEEIKGAETFRNIL